MGLFSDKEVNEFAELINQEELSDEQKVACISAFAEAFKPFDRVGFSVNELRENCTAEIAINPTKFGTALGFVICILKRYTWYAIDTPYFVIDPVNALRNTKPKYYTFVKKYLSRFREKVKENWGKLPDKRKNYYTSMMKMMREEP